MCVCVCVALIHVVNASSIFRTTAVALAVSASTALALRIPSWCGRRAAGGSRMESVVAKDSWRSIFVFICLPAWKTWFE